MTIVDLEHKATPTDVPEIEKYLDRMQLAIELFPSRADFYTLVGRYQSVLNQTKERSTEYVDPMRYFTQAVALEPTAFEPITWQVNYLYQQYDWTQDFDNKLQIALRIGKYEKLAQQILLPIVLGNWQNLTEVNKQTTHQMLHNMLSTSTYFFRQTLGLAVKYCVLDVLAAHASNAQQSNEINAKLTKQQNCP
jgi:hypothetical protein